MERSYRLTRKTALIFRSRAITLFNEAKNTPQSQLLTYHVDHEATPYADLNRYLSNLRKNYDLNSYCSALEITKNNQYHFHLLLDMPFTPSNRLNKAWVRATDTQMRGNALRDHRTIKSQIGALRYCSNYLSKKGSKSHNLKKFSYSTNVIGNEYVDIDARLLEAMENNGQIEVLSMNQHDWAYTGRLRVDKNLDKIFKEINPFLPKYDF